MMGCSEVGVEWRWRRRFYAYEEDSVEQHCSLLYNFFVGQCIKKGKLETWLSTKGAMSKEYIMCWLIWRLVTIHKSWMSFDIKQLRWIFFCLDDGFWTTRYRLRTTWLHMELYNVQEVVGNIEQLIICFLCDFFWEYLVSSFHFGLIYFLLFLVLI